MRHVRREDVLDARTYEAERDGLRRRVMALKARRRVHLGEHLTFLFENFDTTRYQVQEMLRAEGRSSEADVAHELETYNELLGRDGELGCTLLIEIDDPRRREALLRDWRDLPRHLYAEVEDGTRVRPTFDERQVGDERLSSVQYLKFPVDACVPVALGSDHPGLEERVELSADQRRALSEDLAG